MNRKKFLWFFIALGIIGGIILLWYILFRNNNNTSPNTEYNSARTIQNNTDNTNTSNEIQNENIEQNETNDNYNSVSEKAPKETEIASFTTKIYTKEKGRQNNISIACSTLNGTVVENGKTFSFSSTVGKATSGKGYKKADVFKNGDVIEALGGGLCQVSTTLYNAVLKVSDVKVTERHPHSNKVPYIKAGKDAAVSYGAQDFKFVNNTGNSLKIIAENTPNNVTIRIMKLE